LTRIVVSGYYGFGNSGDEAILGVIVGALRARAPQAQIVVLSGNPEQTKALHGVASVSRTTGAIPAIVGADLFLSGGGSLVQDVTSARGALYYLGLLGLATLLARATMVYAAGIGPLRRGWLRALARRILNRVTLITVRDEGSRRLLQQLAVHRPVQVVADPAFALDPAPVADIRDLVGAPRSPRIGVALRPWSDGRFLQPLVDGVREACREIGAEVVALAFHPDHDLAVCAQAAHATRGRTLAGLSPREMMAVVGALDLIVGMRLHALVYAVACGVPLIGITYDPKVEELLQRVGVGRFLPLPALTTADVRREVCTAWDERSTVRGRLVAQTASLRQAALRAADLAVALLPASAGGRGA